MSDVSSLVLKGRNDFLFLSNDSNRVIDQHTGKYRLSGTELQQWLTTYLERKAFCDKTGIDFYVQLSPDKHRIYQEFLPPEVQRAEFTTGDQFSAIARAVLGTHFLDASDVLIPAKTEGEVFHRTDTHWNAKGAYLAYQQFITAVGKTKQLGEVAEFKIREQVLPGDLGCKFSPMLKSTFIQSGLMRDRRLIFSNEIINTGCIKIYQNEHTSLPSCMVFGSSSLYNYYLDYLAESFSTVIFVWDLAFDYDLITRFKPDVILNQVRERFVVRPVKDTVNFTAIDRTVIKTFLLGNNGSDLSPLANILKLDYLNNSAEQLLLNIFDKVMKSEFADTKYIQMLAFALKNVKHSKKVRQLCSEKNVPFDSIKQDIADEIKKAHDVRYIQMIRQSELFDEAYYLNRYKDISRTGVDPARHYFYNATKEKRNPSLLFSTQSYLEHYPDVENNGINPLLHYIIFGKKEGRKVFSV